MWWREWSVFWDEGTSMGHSGDHPCSIEQEVHVDELVRNEAEALGARAALDSCKQSLKTSLDRIKLMCKKCN